MSHGRKHYRVQRVRYANETTPQAFRIDALVRTGEAANELASVPREELPRAKALPTCAWCGKPSLRLRCAAHLFDDDNLSGDICRACVDREHSVREAEPGRYHGSDFEE